LTISLQLVNDRSLFLCLSKASAKNVWLIVWLDKYWIIILLSFTILINAFISMLPPLISRLCRWFMFGRWLLSLFDGHRYLDKISRNFVYVITRGQFGIDCSLFCITFKLRTERFVGSEFTHNEHEMILKENEDTVKLQELHLLVPEICV